MAKANGALEAPEAVETGSWLVFQPADSVPEAGLVLYPGGRVDYRAYAPLARAIAQEGYLVVVPRMPLNLAVLAPAVAQDIITAFPEIEHWSVGGHSLGGAMAAQFAGQNPELVQGLVLMAAYPAGSLDLSTSEIQAVSIYGSLDGVAPPERILAAGGQLPPSTEFVEIRGGNHAQFGWYGPQSGDNQAEISRADQQDQTVAAVIALLAAIGESDRVTP